MGISDRAALRAPFPAFGGKGTIAKEVWSRFGNVANYVEPCVFSAAMLLGRPWLHKRNGRWPTETINDINGFVSNFWRAVAWEPEETARHALWPASEIDMHARHAYLVEREESLRAQLEGNPSWYDPVIAGYWAWGMNLWIGRAFCGAGGAWHAEEGEDGEKRLVKGTGDDVGIQRQRIALGGATGVIRPTLTEKDVYKWFGQLSKRLRHVRVLCGDWTRVCTKTPTDYQGVTAVFMDPPYGIDTGRYMGLYSDDSGSVAADMREWCKEKGGDPMFRIAICGYEGEHQELEELGWDVFSWAANGGYANYGSAVDNKYLERVWFSPHCTQGPKQLRLL